MSQPPHGEPTPPEGPQHPQEPATPPHPAAWPPTPTSGQPYPTPEAAGPAPDADPLTTGPTAAPPAQPTAAAEAIVAGAPAKKHRALIGIVLVVVLLMCAGGGVSAWLLLRTMESGNGAPDPAVAVTDFLDAVYTDKDPERAAELVCAEARDTEEITAKVNEVKGYEEKYESPTFDWTDPEVSEQADDRATVTVRLTMTTADEKTAEQRLRFTVVKKTGWWVCEVA